MTWAVITDDEWLCFGPYESERAAVDVAEQVAHVHDMNAWCVLLQTFDSEVGEQ